jgi:hypothetical protein
MKKVASRGPAGKRWIRSLFSVGLSPARDKLISQ